LNPTPWDLTKYYTRAYGRNMDKPTAMKILGLQPDACAADAKTAYRTLAKTSHPDRFAGDAHKARDAENRMKEINGAFKYIMPRLPEKTPQKRAPGIASKASVSGFFTSVSRHFRVRTVKTGGKDVPPKKKKAPPVPGKAQGQTPRQVKRSFHTFLKTAAPDMHQDSSADTPKRSSGKPALDAYQNYRRHMALKKKVQAQRRRSRNTGIGRVESITPVRRVNPVGED